MTDNSASDVLALRATASGFDAVRDKLPITSDPNRPLENVAVAHQLSALGTLATEPADEVLVRAAGHRQDGHTAPAIMAFAAAVRPASEAATTLGVVAHRLTARDQAEQIGDAPGARDECDYDRLVADNALGMADKALRQTAEDLRAAAAATSPSSARADAARSRSTTPTTSPMPPPAAAPPAAPPGRIARGR
ncbi:hypothetical protein [Streptomyces sp. NPDC094144]|uniref:hypothetical protein n=1 Tax=Streptomyces sp. NPDC094144 TaxID=3366056 RepID=UPI003814B219